MAFTCKGRLTLTLSILLMLPVACGVPSWKWDPEVQTARRACTGIEEEQYACVERHAVERLNPDICRLAGKWIDDMCLQAVYQAASDPAICERLYLKGVRPTCRAYYASLEWASTQRDIPLPLTETYTDTVMGLALDYPAGWQVDTVPDVSVRFTAQPLSLKTVGIVRYHQPASATLGEVVDEFLQGDEGRRAIRTRERTIDGQPAVQISFWPLETERPDTVMLVADPTGQWWVLDGRGSLSTFDHIVDTLRWLSRETERFPPIVTTTPRPTLSSP